MVIDLTQDGFTWKARLSDEPNVLHEVQAATPWGALQRLGNRMEADADAAINGTPAPRAQIAKTIEILSGTQLNGRRHEPWWKDAMETLEAGA